MKRFLISLLALGSIASLGATTLSYTVTVDSSSIGTSTPGFIEFQFNQANASTSPAATASVSDFTSTGFTFDDTTNASLGGVSGSLSTLPLAFDNTVGGTNLYDQGVSRFGATFSFILTLSGAALDNTATDGSEFFVYLLGVSPDYSPLVGTDGTAATVTINGDTTITLGAVTDLSTITVAAATPEPSSVLLFGLGVGMLVAVRFAVRE